MTLVLFTQLVSAGAAVVAVGLAGIQISGLRQDAFDRRAGEISGVAVDTHVKHRPVGPTHPDGTSLWTYTFTVHNPGRFPITNVEVHFDFALDVRRMHYDDSIDDPNRHLELAAPVIPANSAKSWERRIVLDHSKRKALRQTVASVSFWTPDAGPRRTTWPSRDTGRVDRHLDKRLLDNRQ